MNKKSSNGGTRMNNLHNSRAKLKTINGNHKLPNTNGGYKPNEMFTTEFEINETPHSARTLLTKGYVQDEINSFSGATVSTRGRFMTEQEKIRCPHERPLYLFIQGHSKQNVDLALQKINDIIKTEQRSSVNRPSRFTNLPPPLMSLQSGVPTVEKLCIGIENAPQGFDLRGRIIGADGANLLYIRGETGATVTLRGRGSQFVDPGMGTESPEPLHLCIEHPNPLALQSAKQLAINLIQTIQSELQSYIQQQPPPVQSQVIQQTQLQQIQPAQFQTVNIGALAQPNVVTIHQELTQHPRSSVVTIPATILTATVAAPVPGQLPSTGVHVSAPGPIPPPVSMAEPAQVQLIAQPPPGINQVQYQIHPGQPMSIQSMPPPPPPGSQNSAQPMTQMYVVSQPPPQTTFVSSCAPINGAVSYVYTQTRPTTPSQSIIETVNVNLQQPPPAGTINISQPAAPPSLLHLQFPPRFPTNQPPPPISQTYQIQYQPVQTSVAQAPTQFIIHGEHNGPPPTQNHEQPPPQHLGAPFEGQHPPQMHMHPPPPPSSQGYIVSTTQSLQDRGPPPQQPMPQSVTEMQHPPDGAVDSGMPPQPVPPPQMVPPPSVSQMPHSMSIITSVPPPSHPPPQAAPWLYQGQPMSQPPPQAQMPVPMPPPNVTHHNIPPPEMQQPPPPQMQYHPQQVHYQNNQMQSQVHFPPRPPPHFEPNAELTEHHKNQGVKRRFSEVDGGPDSMMHQLNRPPTQRHGTGEAEQQQQHQQQAQQQQQQHMMHGPPGGAGANHQAGERPGGKQQLLMPPPYAGDRRNISGQPFTDHNSGCEQPINGELEQQRNIGPPPPQPQQQQSPQQQQGPLPPNSHALGIPPGAQTPWQAHFARFPPNRPPPMPRDGESHHVPFHGAPPPQINLPPPQLRLVPGSDDNRSQGQNILPTDHTPTSEYGSAGSHPYGKRSASAIALVQSICNPPPPPPSPPTYTQSRHPRGPQMHRFRLPHHHQQQQHHHHHQQTAQGVSPPWMN
ncbi:trithorax group protein osa-like isoform X2 [Trichogramma pretiosum]|uniref:trithorax group protein osa-like isoform X2 n=1 Tax=Trichogramma pretiosum TaxID=7493 RepID=UPI000C71B13D|nr:trithorax group protein osa-like isoform X2 [Trichogramma pretiosum]